MAPRIVLVRHGPTAYRHAGGMVNRDGVLRWREAYDAAGIAADRPAEPLMHFASQATHILELLPRPVTESGSDQCLLAMRYNRFAVAR